MTLNECPNCAEPDPIRYEPEDGEEVAMLSCPECGWEAAAPHEPTEGAPPPATGAAASVFAPKLAAHIEVVQAATLHSVALVRDSLPGLRLSRA